MAKYININQGVILPDIVSMLIRCGIASSRTDLMFKIMRLKDPTLKADKKLFRICREFSKGKEGPLNYNNRQYMKKEFGKILGSGRREFLPNISDIRNPGCWAIYQGFFTGYKSPASKYVLSLCEHEKITLKKIRKLKDSQNIDEHLRRELKAWLRLPIYVLDTLTNTNSSSINSDELDRVKGILYIHKFLHLAAIIDFDVKQCFNDYPSGGGVKRLLPSTDKTGNVDSSLNKLIRILYSSVGYSSQEKFIHDLCKEGMEPESVKKKVNRWKSGESSIDVKKFMELFFSKNKTGLSEFFFPEEILYICIVFDKIFKDCRILGLSPNEIINEFRRYEEYESINFSLVG